MADPIYDIAAVSTNSSGDPAIQYGTVTVTASTGTGNAASEQIFNTINTVLTSAGWTTAASTSSNGRSVVDYYGLQSPWYDTAAVPSWYTKNIPWLRVNAAANGANIHFTPGQWNGTAGTNTATTTILLTVGGNLLGTDAVMHCIANPYQLIVTGSLASASPRGFVMSAVHVPDFVQEKRQVQNAMFAGSMYITDLSGTNGGVGWTLYESNLVGTPTSWTGNPNLAFDSVLQIGGGERGVEPSGNYIWNPTDTGINTSSVWYPMMCPPTVAWADARGLATNTSHARGMLWDSLFINRNYTRLGTFEGLPETPANERRNWLVVGTNASEYQASVITIIGTST